MIRKHLVCVAVGILMAFVFGQELDLNNPSTMASIDTESFSFTYIGHAFGADNDSSYWQNNTVDYPATALLSNMSILKQPDFTIFGGDIVQRCFPQVFAVLETSLLNRLDMPVFNSAGNQDFCFVEQYGFDKTIDFVHGANLFLVISSEFGELEKENQDWLIDKLTAALQNETIKNVFVFTHRPLFLDFLPELQQAASLTNTPVKAAKETAETFLNILDEFPKAQKNVYWLASDVGENYPLISHKYNENVQFIASGLYDHAYDHVLNIDVSSQTTKAEVTISITNLGNYKFSSLEDYSPEWLEKFVKEKAATLDSVTYLKSIKSDSIKKLISFERLNGDAYQNKNVGGYIDWATFTPQDNTLRISGWAPIQPGEEIRRWFGYESDFALELNSFEVVVRQDLVKIFGVDQLSSGFDLTFKLVDSQRNLTEGNLCFFGKTGTQDLFILPFNNNQQTFKCKVFP